MTELGGAVDAARDCEAVVAMGGVGIPNYLFDSILPCSMAWQLTAGHAEPQRSCGCWMPGSQFLAPLRASSQFRLDRSELRRRAPGCLRKNCLGENIGRPSLRDEDGPRLLAARAYDEHAAPRHCGCQKAIDSIRMDHSLVDLLYVRSDADRLNGALNIRCDRFVTTYIKNSKRRAKQAMAYLI